MQRFYKFVFFSSMFLSNYALAEFSSNQRVHSLFNSEILKKDEFRFDLLPLGSAQYGVTQNLELGTSSFLLVGGRIPNFYLKHRMFNLGKTETSFSSFTILSPKVSSNKNGSTSGVFSLHGIVTSYQATNNFFLNMGVKHAYGLFYSSDKNSDLGDLNSRYELDIYMANLGFEYYFSSNWAFNSFVLLPLYMDANLVSDVADGSASAFGNFKLAEDVYLANFALTRSWNIFSLELGLLKMGSLGAIPYLSFIWRTH